MVSIKQVATRAGVSTATVSRTLKQPEVVSAETREQVMAAVRTLGYTPNSMARSLRTLKSQLILVLVPDIGNPFFSQIIQGIEQVAHAHGYSLLLGDTGGSAERETEYAKRVMARQAEGLITLNGRIPFPDYREKLEQGIDLPPIVNACERGTERRVPHVGIDNRAAAAQATQYLLDLGHRRIGFVTGPMSSTLSTDRLAGYRKALQSARLTIEPGLIVTGDFSADSGVDATKQLLALERPPTAIFCSNDEMAIGAMQELRSHGIRVPAQVSVLGFDDIALARFFEPALTTVMQPKLEIGRQSMKLLCDILAGRKPRVLSQTLPFQLVVRSSTARPATQSRRAR